MQHNEYDIAAAFQKIEEELIASMIRNMDRHRAEETAEGYEWSMWQTEQLKALEKYKKNNQKKYKKQFNELNRQIRDLIREARNRGGMKQEIQILQAIKKGWKVSGKNKAPERHKMTAEFFRINDRKLDALVEATVHDMEKAETAILRKANDDYRKAIFDAQVYANSGAGTYEKAVDMATKDMLSRGLNCVEYSNGARHTLPNYADMAIRTASKRAYLQGEGEKRQEWDIHTVIMAKRGNPCPKCLPFVGKVLIDDVWSGGSGNGNRETDPETGKKYPLMSYAISKGLYHPRCKDSHTTYFPGISSADDTWTQKELEDIGLQNQLEARERYATRQEEKYERLAKHSLNSENRQIYEEKAFKWRNARFKTGGLDSREYAQIKESEQFNGYLDATNEWKARATPNSHQIIDLNTYTVNGIDYKVDGRQVVLDYATKEKEIAELLKKELGGEIAMVPRVLNPKGVSTPDYIFRGEAFDLKELTGTSKNLIYNAISKKKQQASNFILDISACPLSETDLLRQVEGIYWSRHTSFVDKLILVKDNQIINIFSRQK
ncbi:phage minor capsid protein [Brotaphodocola sp.]|uniref:phage minor capsid protein n=1 Tax=Brotaphodocola sp. TaxID=3073577 RepID=UPI003D7EA10B